MVHIFHFLQTGMVFEIVNLVSWIFNVISREKSGLISKPFLTCLLDVRTPDFFPPAESWSVNSNFPRASRMQGMEWYEIVMQKYSFAVKILVCIPNKIRVTCRIFHDKLLRSVALLFHRAIRETTVLTVIMYPIAIKSHSFTLINYTVEKIFKNFEFRPLQLTLGTRGFFSRTVGSISVALSGLLGGRDERGLISRNSRW